MKYLKFFTCKLLFLLFVLPLLFGIKCADVKAAETLPVPKLISATANGENAITIQWEKVQGATGYCIFTRKDGESFKALKSAGNSSTFTHTALQPGTRYYYTVRAYKKINGIVYWGKFSKKSVNATTSLSTPVLIDAKHIYLNCTKVRWNAVAGAQGYVVYKKEKGKWVRQGTTVNTKWYDEHYIADAMTFTVRAFRKNGNVIKYSGYNKKGVTSDKYISEETKKKIYKAYSEILKKNSKTSANAFELAYIDKDTIPELLIREGTTQGFGVSIYTYLNNTAKKIGTFGDSGRIGYVLQKGLLWESKIRQWYNENNFYSITNGNVSVMAKFYDTESDINGIYYMVNGNSVSRSDFYSKLSAVHKNNTYTIGGDGFPINTTNINKLLTKPESFIITKIN